MDDESELLKFLCLIMFVAVLVRFIFIPMIINTEPMAEPSSTPETALIFDAITPEQVVRVEETCRRYIALWEQDEDLYFETLNSANPKIHEINLKAKARMNKIADAYNNYILTNGYVFNGTLPEGIYAYIGRVEDTAEQ